MKYLSLRCNYCITYWYVTIKRLTGCAIKLIVRQLCPKHCPWELVTIGLQSNSQNSISNIDKSNLDSLAVWRLPTIMIASWKFLFFLEENYVYLIEFIWNLGFLFLVFDSTLSFFLPQVFLFLFFSLLNWNKIQVSPPIGKQSIPMKPFVKLKYVNQRS